MKDCELLAHVSPPPEEPGVVLNFSFCCCYCSQGLQKKAISPVPPRRRKSRVRVRVRVRADTVDGPRENSSAEMDLKMADAGSAKESGHVPSEAQSASVFSMKEKHNVGRVRVRHHSDSSIIPRKGSHSESENREQTE